MDLQHFIEQLPESELRDLQCNISARLEKNSSVEQDKDNEDEQLQVFSAISKLLAANGAMHMPWHVFKGTTDFKLFRTKAGWLKSYVESSFKPKSKIERDFCYLLVFKLLFSWFERLNIPLSYRTCVNNAERIRLLVDTTFPGYKQANLLNKLIQKAKA